MGLDVFFNELSLASTASDGKETARQWMTALMTTISALAEHQRRRQVNLQFRVDEDFYMTPLAENYTINDWLIDEHVERSFQTRLRSLRPQCPAIADLPEIKEKWYVAEFYYNDNVAKGLGYAWLLESLAVSLRSAPQWDATELTLHMFSFDEHGQPITEQVPPVYHASTAHHIQALEKWLQERIFRQIHDGEDFWNRRKDLFTALIFCPSAGDHLRQLQTGSPLLHQIATRLFMLNDACQNWQNGTFPELPYKVTPESPATMNNHDYAKMRTFRCPPANEMLTFTLHIRVTPGAWRIYFHPKKPGMAYVGYIGPHLPTVEYPT